MPFGDSREEDEDEDDDDDDDERSGSEADASDESIWAISKVSLLSFPSCEATGSKGCAVDLLALIYLQDVTSCHGIMNLLGIRA